MASQHPIPALDWGTAENEDNHNTGAYSGHSVGEGPFSEILNATDHPMAQDSPTRESDSVIIGAGRTAEKVSIQGIVFTRPVPTVSAGSGQRQLLTAASIAEIGGPDPRRSSITVIATQPFYLSNNRPQVQQGVAALIPANTAVVITHADHVYVGSPATNTFPWTISYLVENWQR